MRQCSNFMMNDGTGYIADEFKRECVPIAVANIALLFNYRHAPETNQSALRAAFDDAKVVKHSPGDTEVMYAGRFRNLIPTASTIVDSSAPKAVSLMYKYLFTFQSFVTALRSFDPRLYPMVYIYFIFIYNVIHVKRAIRLLERAIPWQQIANFLTTIIKSEQTSGSYIQLFPDGDAGIQLPEDAKLHGLIFASVCYWGEGGQHVEGVSAVDSHRLEKILRLSLRITEVCLPLWRLISFTLML